jgi:hypothetical protein
MVDHDEPSTGRIAWAMDFTGVCFHSLTSLPVTLEGGWLPPPWREWRGVAAAGEPLVAVAFLDSGAVVEWCKSERRSAENLAVRFLLLPYDADGRDVQVNFSVGDGGCRGRSLLVSSDWVPEIPDRRELRAGVLERLVEVTAEPRVELALLLIARRDVRSARNGLWRVRNQLADLIPEPFRRLLTYGRTGRLATTS